VLRWPGQPSLCPSLSVRTLVHAPSPEWGSVHNSRTMTARLLRCGEGWGNGHHPLWTHGSRTHGSRSPACCRCPPYTAPCSSTDCSFKLVPCCCCGGMSFLLADGVIVAGQARASADRPPKASPSSLRAAPSAVKWQCLVVALRWQSEITFVHSRNQRTLCEQDHRLPHG
jgi:hypothetical protein